jgi:FG-GAP repeat
MRVFICKIALLLICTSSFAQQATEIDSKSIRIPRYSNLNAINAAITSPLQGMMVFNQGTATNWYYNGTTWVNLAMAVSTPVEAEGFGSWASPALVSYQPVVNSLSADLDRFGVSVSISNDYAIVGASLDIEEGNTASGSATIFKRNLSTGVWEDQGKLTDSDVDIGDYFGSSVSISGDYAIIGAYGDDEVGYFDNGSATIFKRNSATGIWENLVKLTNQASENSDSFGPSVCISGDYAIVGAPYDDENGSINNGSATIYKRNSSTGEWESQGKIINPSSENEDNFGISVSISENYAIVGANKDDEGGVNDIGSATIFKRNAITGVWENEGKLTNDTSSIDDNFGWSVSISGDYAIVGAYSDDQAGMTENGSATIYKRNTISGLWESQVKLINKEATNNDSFGISVNISGDFAIIGAYGDNENSFIANGSASIYRRYGTVWRLVSKAVDPGSISNDENFGISAAIDGTNGKFIIGSPGVSNSKGLAIFGKVK